MTAGTEQPDTTGTSARGPVVGLFGLSGAGKTHLAHRVQAMRPKILVLEASDLLKNALGRSGEDLRRSDPQRLRSNQSALANAFAEARSGLEHRPTIVVAHSVIDNDDELVPIPIDAIAPLGIDRFLFLAAPAEAILEQRSNSPRPRPARDAAVLAAHQDVALAVCAGFARETDRPFVVVDPMHLDAAIAALLAALDGAAPAASG